MQATTLFTGFNETTNLGDFMTWAFDCLDAKQGYTLGYDAEDNLVIKTGGETYVRDFPMTIQAGPHPMELGYS